MSKAITSEEDATFLAAQIRNGNLDKEQTEKAFQMLTNWRDPDSAVSIPKKDTDDADVTPGMFASILGFPVDAVDRLITKPLINPIKSKLGFPVDPNADAGFGGSRFFADKSGDKGTDTFTQRVEEDMKKRGEKFEEIKEATTSGDQGYLEAAFQTAGDVGVGAAYDFFGQVLQSGFRGVGAVTPDFIEDPITTGAANAGNAFLGTDLGQRGLQAAMQGLDQWTSYAEENPRAARNIEAVVNIGLLAVPVKGKKVDVEVGGVPVKADSLNGGTWLTKVGQKIEESGLKTIAERRAVYVDDLILPKPTKAVLKLQVPRTSQSPIFQRKIYTLSPLERSIAEEVKKLPAVSPKKTYLDNYDAINTAIASKNSRLMSELRKNDVVIKQKAINAEILPAIKNIEANPMIVGNAELTANKLIAEVNRLISKMTDTGQELTASKLLDIRKQLDAWIRKQKGNKAFDPAQENALSSSLAEIRKALNETVAKAVPDVKVKKALKEQHLLLLAMDNVAPKAAEQASNRFMAAWKRFASKLPIRNELNASFALLSGVGGLGAAAIFAPTIQGMFGLGSAGYYGARIITSPRLRIEAGNILQAMDDLIKKTPSGKELLELKADRALIGSLFQPLFQPSNENPDEEKQK